MNLHSTLIKYKVHLNYLSNQTIHTNLHSTLIKYKAEYLSSNSSNISSFTFHSD